MGHHNICLLIINTKLMHCEKATKCTTITWSVVCVELQCRERKFNFNTKSISFMPLPSLHICNESVLSVRTNIEAIEIDIIYQHT